MAKKDILTKNQIASYLTFSREEIIDTLRAQGLSDEEIKVILKREIARFIKEDIDAGILKLTYAPMCTLMENFKLKDFVSREWRYRPQVISDKDLYKLRSQEKIPLQIDNFDTSVVLNDDEENYTTAHIQQKFYTSKDENIMYGKLVRMKYVPVDEYVVSYLDRKIGVIPYDIEDPALFDKVMSISFCVIMEGKCKDAATMYRYDSSRLKHKNVFIGEDLRREIFGEEVESPHFHFQSEDDSILCLRKQTGKSRSRSYKAGRCNAIDCKHLRKYLIGLDQLSEGEIERLHCHNIDYGMPFLEMAHAGRTVQCNFEKKVCKYLKALPQEDRKELAAVESWLAKANVEYYDEHEHEYVSYDYYPVFGHLIKAVDFIDFVYNHRNETQNKKAGKHLAQLELLVANETVDAFACVEKTQTKTIENKALVSESQILREGD